MAGNEKHKNRHKRIKYMNSFIIARIYKNFLKILFQDPGCWVSGSTYEMGPGSRVSGSTIRVPGSIYVKCPGFQISGRTNSSRSWVQVFGYGFYTINTKARETLAFSFAILYFLVIK